MAWDFSTEPEFEEKLEWMRGFVREEVFPLETLDLTYDQVRVLIRPLQEQVKAQGLWAAHLPPALGGMGFGQVRLGLMHEILGQSPLCAGGVRQQRAGFGERGVAGGRDRGERGTRRSGRSGCSRLLDGELRSAFSMTEPDTAGSDPTLLKTSAVRDGEEWVINGHKWFTSNGSVADFLIVMAVTNPDVHPYSGSSMIIVPVEHAGGGHCAGRVDHGGPAHPVRALREPRRDRLPRRAGAGREPDRRGGLGVRAGAAPARPRPDPPLHAVARAVPSRLRHAVRAGGVPLRARVDAGGEADHPELGGRLDGRDAGGPADDAAGGLEDGPGRGGGGPGRDRHDQVLRGEGPLRRDRPRHPGARVAWASRRTCRWSRCTAMPGRPASTTGPTRCTARPWPGGC